MKKREIHSQNWREFQKREKRRLNRRNLIKILSKFGFPVLGLLFAIGILFSTGNWLSANLPENHHVIDRGLKKSGGTAQRYLRSDLPDLISRLPLEAPMSSHEIKIDGQDLKIETAFDQHLSNHINNLLHRSRTVKAAVVILRADNGQVLALNDYSASSENQSGNYCLEADFPAASLFKIIASAAAIEAKGFTPDKPLTYRGGRYTLYKNQLKRRKSRYNNTVSFKSAFSKSINPVFGQIGIYDLGQEIIAEYGERFLFNREIPFDLRLPSSVLEVPEDDFGLAEIASGFNKRTRISPLHAAMITASINNKGVIMQPWIVSRIINGSRQVVYQNHIEEIARPISERTAEQLKILMRETVNMGTCRVAFVRLRQQKRHGLLDIGAKTGTINDQSDQYKFDWLTAYMQPEKDKPGIAIAVLTVHGEILGIRANDIACKILQYYLKKT